MYHVIEISGYGKGRRYTVKMVIGGLVKPISKPYRSEDAAMAWATEHHIEITKVGDLWEII